MDPLTALGLASNIASFIDFSWDLITGARNVYRSADGTTLENATLETIVADLEEASQRLVSDVKGATPNEIALLRLAEECLKLSQQLSGILRNLKAKVNKNSKWESVMIKLASMRKEKEIMSIESRLSNYRSEILLRLQFMFGHQQSSVKSRLDSIQNDARRVNNEHAKQLYSLRKELLDAVERLRASYDKRGQKWGAERDSALAHVSSNDVCAALKHVHQLSASIPNENEILNRLYFPSMYYREDSVMDAEAETFRWITDDSLIEQERPMNKEDTELAAKKIVTRESFLSWLRNGNGIYHVSGKAGSGKSTLMKLLCSSSRVHEELHSWAEPHDLVFAKFFFWNSGDKLQRSLEGLYRGILFEVLIKHPKLIPQVFPNTFGTFQSLPNGLNLPECRLEEAKVAFMKLVALPAIANHRICLFIDGLDEYEGDSLDYWSIARDMGLWATSENVKICVTSRPYTEFIESFNYHSGQQIHLHQLTKSDIRGYCLAMMEKDRNFELIKESYRELTEDVVRRADGVFLWARLATRNFLGGVSHRDSTQMLRKKLEAIPDDMKNLFDKMLDGIDSCAREESYKLLLIAIQLHLHHLPAILFSWLDELQNMSFPYHAQALRYSEEDLESRIEAVRCKLDSLSKGLLELHTEPDLEGCGKYSVQFFHRTARDYLRDSKLCELTHRLPDFDVQESCCRLLFAYCVFGSMEYDQGRIFDSDINIYTVLRILTYWATPSFNVLEQLQYLWNTSVYSHIPFSFQYTGQPMILIQREKFAGRNEFDYLFWLLCHGQSEFVLNTLLAGTALPKDSSFYKQLFILSVVYGHRNLLRVLLQKRFLSLHDKFTVELGEELGKRPLSLWLIALTLCAQQIINNRYSKSPGILFDLLSWNSELEHDVFFLICSQSKSWLGMKTTGSQQLGFLSLRQLLQQHNTPESKELRLLMSRRKQKYWRYRLTSGAHHFSKTDDEKSSPVKAHYKGDDSDFRIYGTVTRKEEFQGGLVLFIGRAEPVDSKKYRRGSSIKI